MSNTFFNFKLFTVHQDACAMKVCTDACLFGAWLHDNPATMGITHALDIGTGTGLLSLMFAQKNNAIIDAVEIDGDAAAQALKNFEASPWSKRLNIFHQAIGTYEAPIKYDLIFCNPPFFENNLQSTNPKRNMALHNSHFSAQELFDVVTKALLAEGLFAVLIPFQLYKMYEQLANDKEMYLWRHTGVRQTENHSQFRSMLLFGKEPRQATYDEVVIKNNGAYSTEFISLLKDYYLHL